MIPRDIGDAEFVSQLVALARPVELGFLRQIDNPIHTEAVIPSAAEEVAVEAEVVEAAVEAQVEVEAEVEAPVLYPTSEAPE